MLGLFDSGLGGLTVLRRVRALLPAHDVVFLADQAHVPYGERSAEELHELLRRNLGWLDAQGVGAIVMACNTSCAIADRYGYPPTRALVLDLIESATIAMHDAGFARIGVVATAATVQSGAYGGRLRALMPHARVSEVAAPALVPLVEAGQIDGATARDAVAAVCAQLPDDLDAVILACTHYPVLDVHFERALGTSVARIDPAIEQAGRAAALVASRGIPPGSGHTRYVTTGDVALFHDNVRAFLAQSGTGGTNLSVSGQSVPT
ncbi:MAG TPA: glutamate racemase [Candidatus Baltobacteraceae bacterium]